MRRGLSHTGQTLWLDAAENVVSRTGCRGTPYQQYLQMRRRLQIQHYGHEAIPSDDPHRGIPTRERCPPPLVQEVSDDEGDDNAIFSEEGDSADDLQVIIDAIVAQEAKEAKEAKEAQEAANKVKAA